VNQENIITKGTILQRAGDLKKRAYTVKEGLIRSYLIDENGKEHTFMFAPKGWLLADPETNINNNPTQLFVETLEDSIIEITEDPRVKVSVMPKEHLEMALTGTLKRMAVLQNRVLSLMNSPVVKRYEDFIITYPDIVNRVPQHMIASYLGVTPEALSRAIKEIK
tara:strand:- start:52 stop:546 length:495 start_codon:yes stop_codon:yes gene_type:complete